MKNPFINSNSLFLNRKDIFSTNEKYIEAVKRLRNKEVINLFDSTTKTFIKIQPNKQEKDFVCWQKYVSKDKRNWIKHNDYLSLKEVIIIRCKLITDKNNKDLKNIVKNVVFETLLK